MRYAVPVMLLLFLVSCDQSSPMHSSEGAEESTSASGQEPIYSPGSFRTDIECLIFHRNYRAAVQSVKIASVQRQVQHDGTGYLAVAEDMIVLPGVYPAIESDRARDWEFPGTSDVIESAAWQRAATHFAARYNRIRAGG